MRKAHYWKKAGASSAPSNIIVVDVESHYGKPARVPAGEYGTSPGEWQTFRLGVALAYRLERGRRVGERLLHFRDIGSFWGLVRDRLDSNRPLWVFAHNAGYDIPLLNWYEVVFGPDFKCDLAINTQGMFLIRGQYHEKPIYLSDLANYFHCPLSAVGSAVGIPKQTLPRPEESDAVWFPYCENDVQITASGLDALINFTRENELGPWAVSIAGLAFNAFRSRFMDHKILVCSEPDVSRLERNAFYGGVVDTAYIGKVPFSPVHELDVNSMYGWACQQELPYQRIPTRYYPGLNALRSLETGTQAICEVTIDDDTLRLPVRTKTGTVYATGRYRTTLAWPELQVALGRNAVRQVHGGTLYRAGHIFARYMEYFGNKKVWYEGCVCGEASVLGDAVLCVRCGRPLEANVAFRTLCKYYVTNLFGKTGQRNPRWLEWGENALQRLEDEHGLKPGYLAYAYDKPLELERWEERPWQDLYGNWHRCRNWFGYTEIEGEMNESWQSIPAIAATVTSHARVRIRGYQDIAGDRNYCYTDTDSVWVNDSGLANLTAAGAIRRGVFGALEYKQRYQTLHIYGPKDYETDLSVKMKGVKPLHRDYAEPGDILIPFRIGEENYFLIRTADGKYRITQFTRPMTQLKRKQFGGIFVAYGTKRLHREITKCRTTETGWTRPLVFPRENPDGHSRCGK